MKLKKIVLAVGLASGVALAAAFGPYAIHTYAAMVGADATFVRDNADAPDYMLANAFFKWVMAKPAFSQQVKNGDTFIIKYDDGYLVTFDVSGMRCALGKCVADNSFPLTLKPGGIRTDPRAFQDPTQSFYGRGTYANPGAAAYYIVDPGYWSQQATFACPDVGCAVTLNAFWSDGGGFWVSGASSGYYGGYGGSGSSGGPVKRMLP